jgi:hypothetical protein
MWQAWTDIHINMEERERTKKKSGCHKIIAGQREKMNPKFREWR